MTAPTLTGALLTARQTGQVVVGPYATVEIIDRLVASGYGLPIRDDAGQTIGLRINYHGSVVADRLNRSRGTLPDADLPALVDISAVHVLYLDFLLADEDGASSNDIVQILDDWFVDNGFPTVLYRGRST